MKQDIAPWLRAANDAARRGDMAGARHQWQRVMTVDPANPNALNGLGMLALGEERHEEAAALFLRAAESEGGVATLWMNHARVARTLGDDGAERASLLRALEIEPTSLIANVRLAEWGERTDDIAVATEHWKAVVMIADGMAQVPTDARLAVERGRVFVAAQFKALGAKVDAALAIRRAAMPAADRRRIDAAIGFALGRRSIYLNQCAGLHVPFLPADEYFDRRLFPWFAQLEAATATIRSELLSVLAEGDQGFEPYVQLQPGTPSNIWSALDRSMDWHTLHLWRHGVRDEAACSRFPQTAALMETLPLGRLPGRMPTVVFSVLEPRAHIPPHTGVTNSRATIHLPLVVPPNCRFRVGGEIREWIEGQAFAFDDTIEHEAWNDSDEKRVVLILDSWNPHLSKAEQDLLAAFHEVSENSALAPDIREIQG